MRGKGGRVEEGGWKGGWVEKERWKGRRRRVEEEGWKGGKGRGRVEG